MESAVPGESRFLKESNDPDASNVHANSHDLLAVRPASAWHNGSFLKSPIIIESSFNPINYMMNKSVCLTAMNSPLGYSGGRYHAWMLAEALAEAGLDVTYWTDATPLISRDFRSYPNHHKIKLHVDPFFNHPPRRHFDFGWMVPHQSHTWIFRRWIDFFINGADRRLLLNFETPNWYQQAGQREIKLENWTGWELASRFCQAIVSSLEMSSEYAREFYTNTSPETKFLSLPPSINSLAADDFLNTPKNPKRIFLATRISAGNSQHKGSQYLRQLLSPELRGCEFVVLVGGNGKTPFLAEMKTLAAQNGINLVLLSRISDRDKFMWISSSGLTVFPSSFEGYGYPPLESLYCNTPCIAFDLPNYRETCGEGITLVKQGEIEEIKSRILSDNFIKDLDDFQLAKQVGSFKEFAKRTETALESIVDSGIDRTRWRSTQAELERFSPPADIAFTAKQIVKSRLSPTLASCIMKIKSRLHI